MRILHYIHKGILLDNQLQNCQQLKCSLCGEIIDYNNSWTTSTKNYNKHRCRIANKLLCVERRKYGS